MFIKLRHLDKLRQLYILRVKDVEIIWEYFILNRSFKLQINIEIAIIYGFRKSFKTKFIMMNTYYIAYKYY